MDREQLRGPLLECLSGACDRAVQQIPAVNRRCRRIICEITMSPLPGAGGVDGVILRMEASPAEPAEVGDWAAARSGQAEGSVAARHARALDHEQGDVVAR
jgi:hypothetical protein